MRGSSWANFNASTASNTFFFINVSHKSRARQIRCVKQLRSSECIADIYVAVTNGKNLIFTVNVSNLMNKTVFLGLCTDIDNLVVGDVMAFSCFYAVISHISNGKTPIFWVVGAAVATDTLSKATRTRSCSIPIVFLQPMRDMLNGNGVIDLLNRALNRNDVHSNARTTLRNQLGDIFER